MKYNKILWSYWEGDMDNLTKKCIDSWYKYIPNEWEIIIINNSNIHNFSIIKLYRFNELSHTTKSDVIRLSLLYNYGGLWIDASVLLTTHLNWLLQYEHTNYYGLKLHNKSYIESWFIFVPNIYNINILNWLNVFNDILDTQPYSNHIAYTNKCTTDDNYFMIYQAFCYLVDNDNNFKYSYNYIKTLNDNAIKYIWNPMKPIRSNNKLVKFVKRHRKVYKYVKFPMIYIYIFLFLIILFITLKFTIKQT